MKKEKKQGGVKSSLLIFIVFTSIFFSIYTAKSLNGDMDNFMLGAEMFGIPTEMAEKGVTPLYSGKGITGWDGQFYYSMSNDLLGIKDTVEHIDNPPYRYQRIGLSLYTNIISKLFFQDWVSPKLFLFSYFFLIGLAVYLGAKLFSELGKNPFFILLWALSIGTQITLFNGLPDASADAFLIIALYFLLKEQLCIAVGLFVLSALSREVYVIFPTLLLFFILLDKWNWKNSFLSECITKIKSKFILLVIPGLLAVGWQFYVHFHFGARASSVSQGILGAPLQSWLEYFVSGLEGKHLLVGSGVHNYFETACLFLFLCLLLLVIFVAIKFLSSKKSELNYTGYAQKAVATSIIILSLLYMSFGHTVIMHYTGYLKACSVFLFAIPLLLNQKWRANREIYLFLFLLLIVSNYYNLDSKITPLTNPDRVNVTNMDKVTNESSISCLNTYDYKVKILAVNIYNKNLFEELLGLHTQYVFDLEVQNLTDKSIFSTKQAHGSIHMSYHWLNNKKEVVQDGVRTAILETIKPNETFRVSIITSKPKGNDLVLVPSLVQEGCAWFYSAGHIDLSNSIVKFK